MSTSYVDSVATLPRPTVQQIGEFVEYVATAHSWYKHLPLLPPGCPFTFYLDPNAGREWIGDGSRSRFRERVANAPARERFHYTWQTTRDYVSRFGYLTYFADAGTSFRVPMKNGVLDTASAPRIQMEDRRWLVLKRSWISVPEDVRRQGTVSVTGVIHPKAQSVAYWFMAQTLAKRYGETSLDILAYDDSRADEIARTAINMVRSVLHNSEQAQSLPELEELESRVLPAWAEIQKRQMTQAIHRMLDCIYAGRIGLPAV